MVGNFHVEEVVANFRFRPRREWLLLLLLLFVVLVVFGLLYYCYIETLMPSFFKLIFGLKYVLLLILLFFALFFREIENKNLQYLA